MDKKSLSGLCLGILLLFSMLPSQTVQAEPTYFIKFGSSGSDDDEFDDPSGIAISSSGRTVYVADMDNNRINVLDDDGDPDFEFGSFCNMSTNQGCNDNAPRADEDGDGQFNEPIAVAIDSFGDIYVVDSQNDRIQRFDDDGDFEKKFGSSNSNDSDYLGSPAGIAIQKSTRDIYVTSTDTDSISVFDSSGNFLFKFGSAGSDEGEFRNPSYMTIDDTKEILYVADTDNDRIQIFELVDSNTCPQGTDEIVNGICFVEEFGSTGFDEGEFISPMGLAIDTTNDLLYVADNLNNRIQIFELVDSNTCPQGTDEIVNGVCFVEEFGSIGSTNSKFSSPMGLALDTANDLLYVVDSSNDRVQVFKTSATPDKKPERPTDVTASAASPTSIALTWNAPILDDKVPSITGYKVEFKTGSDNFSTLVSDTKSTNTSILHQGLEKGETYVYRVYAINSIGTSTASLQSSAKPQLTTVPSGFTAVAISPNQIELYWIPPSETFGQTISGYIIKREIIPGVYDEIAQTSGASTTYTVSSLTTGKTYTYVVIAKFPLGTSDVSNTASATPEKDSSGSSSSSPITIPTSPLKLTTTAASSNQINLSWTKPSSDGNSAITGYKIETKKNSGSYSVLVSNTKSTATSYTHTSLTLDATYTYRVSAINSIGTSNPSADVSVTLGKIDLTIKPLGKFVINEEKTLSFSVSVTDSSLDNLVFSLDKNPPAGAKINSNTGKFTWTPTKSQGSSSYTFDLVVKRGTIQDRQSVTITVNDVPDPEPDPPSNMPDFVDPKQGAQYYLDRYNNEQAYKTWFDTNYPDYTIEEAIELTIPGFFSESKEAKPILDFVDQSQDPQYYIDRYNNEATYKAWFDKTYPDYTIEQAVGFTIQESKTEAKPILPFVDPTQDTQYYIDRYNSDASFKEWFDDTFPDYTIYEAVGEESTKQQIGICGPGTIFVNGYCETEKKTGGGCLIATAAFGSELAPQVQKLRELRDNTLLQTNSGTSFMDGFNELYYSFSPTIADLERENPLFKEAVKLTISPLLSSLSILNYVDIDTEEEMLGYGIGVILLNIGIYFVAPMTILWKFTKLVEQRLSNSSTI